MKAPKVIFLYTHCRSLGHSTRISNLAASFKSAWPEGQAWIFNGGTDHSNYISYPDITLINLPPYAPVDGLFGELVPLEKSSQDDRLVLIKKLLREIKADVIVTEFFPFGRRELEAEFIATIEAAKNVNPSCQIISSVRDIVGHASNHTSLINYFDHFWVHGDPDFLAFDHSIESRRLHYTGYLTRSLPYTKLERDSSVFRICASIGGAKDGQDLISSVLISLAKNQINAHIDYVLGPYAPTPVLPSASHVTIHRDSNDPRGIMAASDCCISMMGYNTFVDQIQVGVPFIVLPRATDEEQPMRAKAWQERGGTVLWQHEELFNFNWRNISAPLRLPAIDGYQNCIKLWRELWD